MKTTRAAPPSLAIVGRTNVGKSTLFNRLIEERKAIVSDVAGTTRDRNFGSVIWRGRMFVAVDTAGLDVPEVELKDQVLAQLRIAMRSAEVIVMLVDTQTESPTPEDRALAKVLRGARVPVLLAANKCDSPRKRALAQLPSWRQLGLGAPIAISAANGSGVGDLLDSTLAAFRAAKKRLPVSKEEPATRVAFLGQPNVGKSSIVNAMLGEERVVVADFPGTTREPQDTFVLHDEHPFILIDTVGIRRRARHGPLEKTGVQRSLQSAQRSDVVMLVLDASTRPTAQDRRLAGELIETRKGFVVVVNKWDLVPGKTTHTMQEYTDMVRAFFPFLGWARLAFISAKSGDRVTGLYRIAREIVEERRKQIPEEELDTWLRTVQRAQMKGMGVAHPKTYRFRQTGTEPPAFELVVKGKAPIPDAYTNFLEKRLRERFGFAGTPIRMTTKTVG